MKRLLRHFLESRGVYIKRYHNSPGVDWGLDAARALKKKRCEVLFDVGANTGQTAEYLTRRFPKATVHAFEPIRQTYEQLVRTVGGRPGVRCYQLAMSDSLGTARMSVAPDSVFSSLRREALFDQPDVREEDVALMTADEFCKTRGIDCIDIFKTDTEGHDLQVLGGAEGLIARGKVRAVYTEVTFSPANPRNTLFFTAYEYLLARGFRFMGLYEVDYFQRLPQERAFCNALFVLASEIG